MMENIIEQAAPFTHESVFKLMVKRMGTFNGKSICDVPCGRGAFSARLQNGGALLTSLDIAQCEPFLATNAERVFADIDAGLPFIDRRFDALVTIEGMEHLENPSFFLRECARVIKDDGWIFLSTPNVDSYRSRRSVFFQGYPRFFRPGGRGDKKESGHIHPIDMAFFSWAVKKAGMEIVETAVNVMDKNIFRDMLRPLLTRRLPIEMRGEIPYYGEVIIYVLKKRN